MLNREGINNLSDTHNKQKVTQLVHQFVLVIRFVLEYLCLLFLVFLQIFRYLSNIQIEDTFISGDSSSGEIFQIIDRNSSDLNIEQ